MDHLKTLMNDLLTEREVKIITVTKHVDRICVVELNAVNGEQPHLFDGPCE